MIVEQSQIWRSSIVVLGELTGKLDPTKIRVTQGDIPTGDWIFNRRGMVFLPKNPADENGEAQEKIVINLENKINVTPVKAEDFGVIRQFGADMSPLAGAVAGALTGTGFFGLMTGFAAGTMLGRNLATFSCELEDGRRFMGIADIKIFKRLKSISKNKDNN
jgi:hypothetical protein